jgi:hypothetical protein
VKHRRSNVYNRIFSLSQAGPNLSNKEKLLEMADPTLQGRLPLKSLCTVAAIAAMCVQAEADYRPLMGDIVETLLPLAEENEGIPPHVVIDLAAAVRFLRTAEGLGLSD